MTAVLAPTATTADTERLIDFGLQPLTNRFLRRADEAEERFPLALEVNSATGLVQLAAPAAPVALRARYDWIKYNEAEDHLDDLVARLRLLSAGFTEPRTLGLSYKDDSTLERLRRLGWKRVTSVRPAEDLGLESPLVGLESLQAAFTPAWARSYVAVHGKVEIVMARHIWEHCHDRASFLAAMRELLVADGLLVLEVPDCTTQLETCDYSMPWEEHVAYFTPATFHGTLAAHRWNLRESVCYPYPLENSLVAFARPSHAASFEDSRLDPEQLSAELMRARRYAADFAELRAKAGAALRRSRMERGPVAVLGAGHLATMFINLLDLGSLLEFVMDDAPVKQGLFLPGNRLPIVPSSRLARDRIALCLLSVNHNTEARVIARQEAFTQGGGEFRSLFPSSSRAFLT